MVVKMAIDYSKLTEKQLNIIEDYCKDNMKKLKKICYPIWGNKGLPSCYHDDLYDDAMKVLVESVISYKTDNKTSFKTFLANNINFSQREWYRNNFLRAKRNNLEFDKNGKIKKDKHGNPIIVKNVSLDTPIGEDEIDLKDVIASDFKLENEVDLNFSYKGYIDDYLKILSPTQRNIAEMIMKGFKSSQIKEKLKLTDKQYENHMKYLRCDKNTSILTRIEIKKNNEVEDKSMNNNQTFEKSKVEKLSIASIIKKINNRTLRYDHPLQRESDQWSIKMKSNLISDVLQVNPIPALVFAEQVINGISITWNLDGKQRSTNVKEFVEDKFKISKSVRRNLIQYQAIIRDENGEIIPDENGFPQAEWREFDIVNKKFSQLPEELKERIMDYCFDITLYMNCSDEDIAYHIERHNDGKAMASSQKSIIKIGEDYARMIKGIAAMPFFKENGFNYTQSKNGTIDRVCIESVMATEFLDKWKTSPEDIANFLKRNATEEHFDNLEDTVDRLEKVITDDIGEMFDKKDSFIYFSVFARFKKTGLDDEKFVEFMTEYAQSLHNKFEEIENVSVNGRKRSTKDKSVVIEKIEFMESLMNEYLHIDEIDLEKVNTLDFVRENVKSDATEEDVSFYSDMLDDYTLEVDNNTKLLDEHNRPSLVALVGYACENECDDKLTNFIKQWFAINTMYILNQQKNYETMLASFQKGCVA